MHMFQEKDVDSDTVFCDRHTIPVMVIMAMAITIILMTIATRNVTTETYTHLCIRTYR